MEYLHLRDINLSNYVNDRMFVIFMLQDIKIGLQKDGVQRFASIIMQDRGVSIEAKRFGVTDNDIDRLQRGKVFCAAVDVKEYKGSNSCVIYNYDEFDESAVNFIPYCDGIEEASKIINNSLSLISNTIYGKLVYNLLISKWDKFSRWTAASGQHHNLLGGLLVHTSEVVSQSMILANYWDSVYGKSVGETNKSDEIQKQANAELPCIKNETTSSVENNPNANNNNFINMPLLISGALLHDLGKVEELGVDALTAKTEYTERASLETHITIVASMIDIEAYKLCIGYKTEDNQKSDETIEKEKEAITLLKHLIFSHHGKLEYGSCIAPHTPEAEILNTADELSAKMFKYNRAFKNIQPATSEKKWASDGLVVCYKDSSKK